jgi:1-phosphofructokinase/tagatose 6-phosphate kinase
VVTPLLTPLEKHYTVTQAAGADLAYGGDLHSGKGAVIRLFILNLNPGYDHWVVLDEPPELPHILRGESVVHQINGKGLNIARVLSMLSDTEYICMNILGGAIGRLIAAEAAELGIPTADVWIAGETRMNISVVHQYEGRNDVQVVNESGPRMTPEEVAELKRLFAETLRPDDLVVVSGSVVPGFTPDDLRELAAHVASVGASLAIDIAGQWLEALVQDRPSVLKVNHDELRLAFSIDPEKRGDLLRFRQRYGIDELIITYGARGAVAFTDGAALRAVPPDIQANFAVGSGDSFFAGYLHARKAGALLADAMRNASACGVANASKYGAALITREEYEGFIDQIRIEEVQDEQLFGD